MKEFKRSEGVYLTDYDVTVQSYLEMAQVASIIEGVCAIENGDFLTRKMNEDMLILLHCTDIGQESLEQLKYEDLVVSGLIHTVRNEIKNIHLIKEGIEYNESFLRAIALLAPKIVPLVEKVEGLYDKKNEKDTDKK